MDHEKPTGPIRNLPASGSEAELAHNPSVDDFFRRLKQDLHHPKPGTEAIAAALQAVQRLASQVDTDASASAVAEAAGVSHLPLLRQPEPGGKPVLRNLRRSAARCPTTRTGSSNGGRLETRPRTRPGSITIIIITITTIFLLPREAFRSPAPSRAQRAALRLSAIPTRATRRVEFR